MSPDAMTGISSQDFDPQAVRSDDGASIFISSRTATGDTVHSVARACLVQFEGAEAIEHIWSMVRTKSQIERVIAWRVEPIPASSSSRSSTRMLRGPLVEGCRKLQVPAIPVLDPVIGALALYLGRQSRGLPGQQHLLDSEYFQRIDAMTFALNHDDGQSAWGLNDADVVLVGVSRTSKTPTCIYLANRGIKAANVPIVPGVAAAARALHHDAAADRRPDQRSRAPDPGAPQPAQHAAPAGRAAPTIPTSRRCATRCSARAACSPSSIGR